MREFGNSDEACEISQVRTFVVIFDEAVVLGIISLAEGF